MSTAAGPGVELDRAPRVGPFRRQFAKGRPRREPGTMNGTEKRYAALLESRRQRGLIQAWEFECHKLKIARLTFYTPDFFVLTRDGTIEFHEVKGFMQDDAAVKIKTTAERFWWFRFVIVRWKAKRWTAEEVGTGEGELPLLDEPPG